MNFINIKNKEKKLYSINYNNYLEWFLADKNLLVSVSSDIITFRADSLVSMAKHVKTKFLTDDLLSKFVYDLGSQILYLKDNNIGIFYFDLNDIIIINSSDFLFINPNKLFKKGNTNSIQSEIWEKNISEKLDFMPPELKNKNINISLLQYSTAYYSLAKLILYVFDLVLDDIYFTSIYFFLHRCLEVDPKKRELLYL